MKMIQKHWDRLALAAILVLAAFLTIWGIWNQRYSNEFYAAAVKSMTMSWKNFFFVSLDPGGWVTVDKPPVSLWIQTAFAKLFGFYGWSIILPQCLAAVGSVAIIQHVVRRHFGKIAGLISALALALSPIFIVVSKTNNTDAILIFFMMLATWAFMVAADKGKLRFLILSMVLLGIAYNAKTLEAFLILPGMYLAYFFATNLKWRKRIIHLLVATAVLAGVSLSWSIAVDLTPASERPYVDNSSTNSELELALGYNGIQRIVGQSGGKSGGMSGQSGSMQRPEGNMGGSTTTGSTGTSTPGNSNSTFGNGGAPGGSFSGSQGAPSGNFGGGNGGGQGTAGGNFGPSGEGGRTGGFGAGGGNSMFNGGGSAGITRMFNSTLGGQDSWLLPFGFFTILALLLGLRKSAEKDSETRKKRLRNVLFFGVSVLIMFAYFDVSSFFHPYYISVLCPFLAALVGIGVVEMWKLYKQSKDVFAFLLPVAFAVTLAVQIAMLTAYPAYAKILIPLIAVFAGIPTVVLFIAKFLRKEQIGKISMAMVSGVTVAGLFLTPAVWTIYSVASNSFNSSIPTAGPSSSEGNSGMPGGGNAGGFQMGGYAAGSGMMEGGRMIQGDSSHLNRGSMGGGFGNGGESQSSSKLVSFLLKNNTGEKWLIAVPDASEAESIILATGKPVMAIGGFSGNDNTLTVSKLEQLVKSGQLKYFMVGGKGGNTSNAVTAWVKANGTVVSSSEYSDTKSDQSTTTSSNRMEGGSTVIYDLSAYKSK